MEDDFKHLVRISRKDVDGNKTIQHALTEIKGIGLSLSRSICLTLGLNTDDQIGYISEEDVSKIEALLENPQEYNIPDWITKVEDTKLVYQLEDKELNLLSDTVLLSV